MRRIFIIFLLLFMPLQLTWAAVGNYCQHETGAAAKHFGHHAHQHQDGNANSTDASDLSQPKPLGAIDADCSFCHVCSIAILATSQALSPPDLMALTATPHHDGLVSPSPTRPERPNWATLA